MGWFILGLFIGVFVSTLVIVNWLDAIYPNVTEELRNGEALRKTSEWKDKNL